jgi:hypothetical protein
LPSMFCLVSSRGGFVTHGHGNNHGETELEQDKTSKILPGMSRTSF